MNNARLLSVERQHLALSGKDFGFTSRFCRNRM
jgi:hypothetical protein